MPNQRTRQKKKEAAAAAAEAKKEAAKPKAAAKPAPVPTPPGGRQRGVCRWFVDKKKYGFISSGDGRDIFVHGADLKGAIGEGVSPKRVCGQSNRFSCSNGQTNPFALTWASISSH